MIESMLLQASSFADDIDNLINLIAIIVGFWFVIAEGVFFWFLFRYRKARSPKAQYITGEEKHQTKWISYPHFLVIICDIVIVAGAIMVWVTVKQELPAADAEVRIIGQQWAWTFVHEGPDRKLGTEDDIQTADELHVEEGKTYHFYLEATDVLHSFSVPVFRLKQDAIPGRIITGWFKPTKTGEFDLQCAEMCGIGHGVMRARIHIETPEQHAAWMQGHSKNAIALAPNNR